MKVLLQGRSAQSLASTPGGDQVLIDELAARLRSSHGVQAIASSELTPDLTSVDAVHLFGLVRPQDVWVQARHAALHHKPIFLSPVYCDVWEFEQRGRGGAVGLVARRSNRDVIEALKAAGRGLNSREWGPGSSALFTRGFQRMQREVLALSSVFMPNSRSEWRRLTHDFGLSIGEDVVKYIPIGIEPSRYAPLARGAAPPHLEPFRDCVLCVARVEGRKNQLALIEAVRDTGLTLVLAGKDAANQPAYVARVRRAARANPRVHLIGSVTDEEKHWLYRLARVHALPSWMETAGLSSLEAAMASCSLVVSPNGDTADYFGAEAEYCDPADPVSIRTAVMRAFEVPASNTLAEKLRTSYTWDRAAELTHQAYVAGLADRPIPSVAPRGRGPWFRRAPLGRPSEVRSVTRNPERDLGSGPSSA